MIIITKSFSEGQIDISHLSPGAQKRIIERERKKIELDQKIADTKSSIGNLRQRASMNVADNAKIGAMKMKKNPLMGAASSIGGMTLASQAADKVTGLLAKNAPNAGGLATNAALFLARAGAYKVVPAVASVLGRVAGAVRGLTARGAARRKERKLARLSQQRAKLEANV